MLINRKTFNGSNGSEWYVTTNNAIEDKIIEDKLYSITDMDYGSNPILGNITKDSFFEGKSIFHGPKSDELVVEEKAKTPPFKNITEKIDATDNKTNDELQVGDIVRLKARNGTTLINMVVGSIGVRHIICFWQLDGQHFQEYYPIETLEKVEFSLIDVVVKPAYYGGL